MNIFVHNSSLTITTDGKRVKNNLEQLARNHKTHILAFILLFKVWVICSNSHSLELLIWIIVKFLMSLIIRSETYGKEKLPSKTNDRLSW